MDKLPTLVFWGFPGSYVGKEYACNVEGLGSIPGLGRFPGGGHDRPLQYPCLENPHAQRSLAECSPWRCRVGHDWATKHSSTKQSRNVQQTCLDAGGSIFLTWLCHSIHRMIQRAASGTQTREASAVGSGCCANWPLSWVSDPGGLKCKRQSQRLEPSEGPCRGLTTQTLRIWEQSSAALCG